MSISENDCAELGKVFIARLGVAVQVFGDRAFHYENEDRKWVPSQTLYDGVMVAIDRLWKKKDTLIAKRKAVSSEVHKLLKDKDAFEVVVGRPNTARAVQKRMDLLTKAMDC